MMSDLQVIALSSDVTVATYRQVLFVHFRGSTPATCVADYRRAMVGLKAAYPQVVFFAMVEQGSTPPDSASRSAATKFFEDEAATLAGVVAVYLGDGFRGATVRTIISGILNLSPRFRLGFPRHVLSTIEEGADVAAQLAPALDGGSVAAAFHELRAMEA